MSLYALREINRIFNNSITAYENRLEREYQKELELEEDLTLQIEEWKSEFEETIDNLTIDTKYGDATYKKVIKNMELITNGIKEYYRKEDTK